MKAKLFISVAWVLGTFLLLSWMFYAANDYDRSMLGAVTGERGVQPTLDRAKSLEAQKRNARTSEEALALDQKIGEEILRYGNAQSAAVSQRRMIERAWILWGVSAFAPLLFIWSSQIVRLWRPNQTVSGTHEMEKIRDETHVV